MKIVTPLLRGTSRLRRIKELSREANQRLKWFDYYERCGHNARLTCRHFDISPQTFYRWKRRYDPKHVETLEDHSHRPRHIRQPTYSVELVEAVVKLREKYPRWGKNKLVILLQVEGYQVSASTVGRILRYAKGRGILNQTMFQLANGLENAPTLPESQRSTKLDKEVILSSWTLWT